MWGLWLTSQHAVPKGLCVSLQLQPKVPELRSSDISTMSHRHDRYSWSLRHHCSARGSAVYHPHGAGPPSPLLPIQFPNTSLSLHFSEKKNTSTRLPSRVRWKSGSAWKWHHQAKKWTVWKREIQSEGENTVNTVKCSVIVMYASQRPPSTPPPETGQPSPPSFPQLPACCRPELWGGDVIGCNVSYTESD